jgi:hypothetical protein
MFQRLLSATVIRDWRQSLMTDTETVSETLEIHFILTWLIAQEGSLAFRCDD